MLGNLRAMYSLAQQGVTRMKSENEGNTDSDRVGSDAISHTEGIREQSNLDELVETIAYDSASKVIPPNQLKAFASKFRKAFLSQVAAGQDPDQVLVMGEISRTHSGPLPPPDVLLAYESSLPGAMDRIFQMAEADQAAYLASIERQQKSDNTFRLISYFGGLFAFVLALGTATLLSFHGYTDVALAVVGSAALGAIAVFVNAWQGKKPE